MLIATTGIILMSIESLLIKMTSVSGITYSFYIGILMFISSHTLLLKDGLKRTIQLYKVGTKIILFSGLLMGLSNMFFINALKYTSIANAVVILSSAPLFSTLFAYLFYKEKAQKNIFIASIFILIGLIVIFSEQLGSGNLQGDILALLCVMTFSFNYVFMYRYKNVNRIVILAFSGICITIISLFFIESFTLDTTSFYIILIAGLLISPLSRLFLLLGTRTLSAAEMSLFTILETVLAPIWGWIFINEIPHVNTIIGGAIILSTIVINSIYMVKVVKSRKTYNDTLS